MDTVKEFCLRNGTNWARTEVSRGMKPNTENDTKVVFFTSCPTSARVLGDLKNPDDPIHDFLRTHKVQVLKPQMATGSKLYYSGLDGAVR